jgi:hypothetical protein
MFKNLTKTQIYIISAIVIGIIVYFMFFRKTSKPFGMTPPAPVKANPSESNYYGDNWGWKTGPQSVSPEQTLAMVSANVNNSVAGTMTGESNYQQDELTGGKMNFESNYSQEMLKVGSGLNWLSTPKNGL